MEIVNWRKNGISPKSKWPPSNDVLEELYWAKRFSLKQVGELFGKDAKSIWRLMRKKSIRTRSVSEAMTKYAKWSFSGDSDEKAYLLGLRAGDLYVRRHGGSIRATVSTTHPAMIELIKQVFGKYARVVVAPKFLKKWNQFEWEVYSLLHSSFEFLLTKRVQANESFLSFLAGFFDAEGSISIRRQSGSTRTRVVLEISSNNLRLLRFFYVKLRRLGYHPNLPSKPARSKGDMIGYGPYTKNLWRLSVTRTDEAVKLLSSLPIKHKEKVLKKEIAIQCHDKPWKDVSAQAEDLRQTVKKEVKTCINEAKKAYLTRHKGSI